MPKLFQLFGFLEATKQLNTKGIGLGLHITRKITRMFDGDIVCHSQYGKGTNFIFLMALAADQVDNLHDVTSNNRILNPIKKEYKKIEI